MAATNVVGVILFATLYAVAGAGYLSRGAFVACLALLFGLVTALWVRVEARHRALAPLSRAGRAIAGLLLVVIAVPGVVLTPLFWVESKLPPDAGFNTVLAPVMALVLISLALVLIANVAGALVALGRGVLGARSARTTVH